MPIFYVLGETNSNLYKFGVTLENAKNFYNKMATYNPRIVIKQWIITPFPPSKLVSSLKASCIEDEVSNLDGIPVNGWNGWYQLRDDDHMTSLVLCKLVQFLNERKNIQIRRMPTKPKKSPPEQEISVDKLDMSLDEISKEKEEYFKKHPRIIKKHPMTIQREKTLFSVDGEFFEERYVDKEYFD
jgi:hypothetical protein